ncbi:Kinesin-like protein [Colletotrichum higginsianum IMI 349063]|uniref:Kinesin-like protein n=2 Tax=Colletotrichum higginsianum (strain IMI 349063) TaxID=759273 RepID=A0A1B7YLF5_COLHI|nr:Kinesin-like protein [Colletotrichum higginsianum IMI 349063]OBR12880.1 Kinesin-like protein [Colletotrichum higginsianum IMI 349063]
MVPEALMPAVIEMWVEYAVGILVLFLRIFTRYSRVVGLKWQGDDYLAVAAVILFTFEVMMCQIIVEKGSITGMTDEVALTLTPEEYKSHEVGAKWLFAAWYIYVSMIWSLKGIMLFFFARVTKTLPEERLVKVVSVVTVAGYLATLGVVTGHCRPMHKLWQVYPYPGDDCSQNTSKYYALVSTNVATDIMIMYIPIPLLWRLQTTLKKKLAFGLMFCAGFFIIICTLLRCIICLQTPERLDLGLNWSIRETVVAIICTNAPSIKPLFPSRKTGSANTSTPSGLVTFGGSGGTHKMSRIKGSHQKLDDTSVGSQEHIVNPKGTRNQTTAFVDDHSSDDGANYNRGIQVTNEYTVEVGRQ